MRTCLVQCQDRNAINGDCPGTQNNHVEALKVAKFLQNCLLLQNIYENNNTKMLEVTKTLKIQEIQPLLYPNNLPGVLYNTSQISFADQMMTTRQA